MFSDTRSAVVAFGGGNAGGGGAGGASCAIGATAARGGGFGSELQAASVKVAGRAIHLCFMRRVPSGVDD
jgi:hypothetical protein